VIETPMRRGANEIFPLAALADVVAVARAEGVACHLDGARLPIAAASAGRSIAAFAAPFDTVYLSLWKLLGLPYGAALAGPAAVLDGITHDRRRHGGALPQLWPLAAMVLADLDAKLECWPMLLERSVALRTALATDRRFKIAAIGTEPTNAFRLTTPDLEPATFRVASRAQGLVLPEPQAGGFAIRANAGWLATGIDEIARRLGAAATQAARRP
jgi:threonine aldolase